MLSVPVDGALAVARLDDSLTVYTGATVLTGEDGPPILRGRVVVRGEHIECVSDDGGCPAPSAEIVDLRGMWLGPGLVDAHVHLELERAPQRVARQQALRLAFGITTVRDAGTLALDKLLAERERSEVASAPVPRVLVTARPEPFAERFGTNHTSSIVGRLAELGVDGIKLKDPVEVSAVVESIQAAKALGLTVSGHTWNGPPPKVMLREAVAAGIDGIVHLGSFAPMVLSDEINEAFPDPDRNLGAFFTWRKELWNEASLEQMDPVLRDMVDRRVWLEPSLAFEYWFGRRPALPPDLEFVRGAPMSWRELAKDLLDRRPPEVARYEEPYARMESLVLRFHELGGRLVAGSDGVLPGIDLFLEMDRLEAAGLNSQEALQAATRNAADAVGRGTELGTIAPGKYADLVVYSADPLASSEGRLAVHRVIKGGFVHNPELLLADLRTQWRGRSQAVWRSRALRFGSVLVLCAFGVFLVVRSRLMGRRR